MVLLLCFKMWKDLEGEKRKQNVIRRGKKKILWMLPGGEDVKLDLNFLFVCEKNVTACEIWGPWRTKCFKVTLWNNPQIPHVGCFCHMTEQLVTDSESSGAPFSALTNLRLPITYHLSPVMCFPVVKNLPANAGHERLRFSPWVGKMPWRRTWQPTPVFLPGESPWTEEPGGLQSMRSQRVGNGWGCTK